MTTQTIRPSIACAGVHLLVGGLIAAGAAVSVATNGEPTKPIGYLAFALGTAYILWAVALRGRAFVRLGLDDVDVRNVVTTHRLKVDQIESVRIVERWWSNVGYGQLTSLQLSTPTVRLRDVDGRSYNVIAMTPMRLNSPNYSQLLQWCRTIDVEFIPQ